MRRAARRVGLALVLVAVAGTPASAQVTVRSAVSMTRFEVGESIDWIVSLSGVGAEDAPEIPALDWAVVQERGTQQNLAWINGRSSARTIHHYRLTATREGRFSIPAVTVRFRGRAYVTDPITVEVLPAASGPSAAAGGAGGGDPRLRLVATLVPGEVVVGEPVVLFMRLYQGVRVIADPVFSAPATPRFYAEKTGPMRTESVTDANGRWLVGETRTVLYPTVPGRLTVGPARFTCLLADRDFPAGVAVEAVSRPVTVDVRPLPPSPAGEPGAVADARLTGAVDRTAVRADEAVEVTFRLAGRGNLRLAQPPALPDLADFEIFDRRVEDSLEVDDGDPRGAKIVRYTLLPRRAGPLDLPPISYRTYVPGEGWRTLAWAGATIDVAPGLDRDTATPAAERAARLVPTADPGGSPLTAGRPWAGAAFVLFAAALWLSRLRLRPRRAAAAEGEGEADPAARARRSREAAARLAAHRAALAAARARSDHAAFWRRAEEALAEVDPGDGGPGEAELRARIAAARYAPGAAGATALDALAGPLDERLRAAERTRATSGRTRAPRALRIAAAVLALAGVASLALGARAVAGHPDDAALGRTLDRAAAELSGNDVPAARARLLAAWNAGARRPGVALDLALAAWYERRLGETALWTERARRLDPRHPLVATLIETLREEGTWEGLPTGLRARTTGGEIAFAACVLLALALLVFVAARRRSAGRWTGRLLVTAALALAVYAGQSGAAGEAPGRALVLRPTPLSPAPGVAGDIELEPGRALWLEGRAPGGWTRVRISSQVRGVVPAAAVRAI